MKTWSLRIKIVMMATVVVTIACLSLTAISIVSANKYMRGIVSYDVSAPSDGASNGASSDQATSPPPIPSITENQIAFQDTLANFSMISILSMLLAIVILAISIFMLTGKILKPLRYLTDSICSIDDHNLRHRVGLPQTKDEVYHLTQSFNNMMDRLESSYTAQKNFAANAAHELKTSLAIMKTSLQVLELQERPSYEDYSEFADDVKQSIDRLIHTVESLLTLTNCSLTDDTETINALDIAKQIKNDLSPFSDSKDVCIAVSGDDLLLTYNKELFYRALYNLVENAVKYNSSGGYVDITVSNREQYIRIKDDGIGMDSLTIKNIFEPFYRSDLARSKEIPGSGLGMSIVKVVLERYGAALEIDSALGKGTEIKWNLS